MKIAKILTALLLGTACTLGFSLTPTTTALTSSINPSVYEQPVTFTAVVTPKPPDGETVTFLEGKTVLGTGTLSSGSTTFTISTLTTGGTDNIKAEYPGDATLASSTSNVVEQVVDKATTTTALVSSPNPSKSGQPVTFTATVTGQYGGTPTGKVTFYNGSTKLALVALSGGVASYTTSSLPGGTDPITAAYGGSNSFSASTSAVLNQTVNGGSGGPTTTTLTSSMNPSDYGEAVTFTAVVTPAPPNGETVEFIQGAATELGTGTLSGGTATFTISTLTTGGTDNVKAEYPGDSNFGSSKSNVVKQVVDQATSTTALTSSLNPSNGRQPVTFTATVRPQYSGTPTGKVQFYDGSAKLGLVALSSGVASYTTSSLPSGTDPITAVYNGSSSFLSSTSAVLNQTVNGSGPGNCGTGTFIDSSMTWNGITRYYEVYQPAGLPANSPMVLMLHGTRTTPSTGSNPEPVISLNWGWTPVADQYCFILVKPASTYDPKSHQWNWNAYCMDGTALCAPYGANGGAFAYAEGCGSLDEECPDDIGFLGALIQNLIAQYNVNPNQVYVTGFSSGAQMTERVGLELSNLVAAVAPVAGPIYNAQGTVPAPLPLPPVPPSFQPISVQLWEGTEDHNLWPCGYGQTNYSGAIFTVDSADDTFNFWSGTVPGYNTNSCTKFQTTATLCANGEPNNANDAPTPGLSGDTGNIATSCANNVEVQVIWEPGVAHSSQPQTDANRWLFFAAHPKQQQ